MTHDVETADITKRYDAKESMASIARSLGVSIEVVRYRLKKAGYQPKQRRMPKVNKERVRKLREHMPTLIDMKQFMEAERRTVLACMGGRPRPEALDKLGTLTDFINTLEEVTA